MCLSQLSAQPEEVRTLLGGAEARAPMSLALLASNVNRPPAVPRTARYDRPCSLAEQKPASGTIPTRCRLLAPSLGGLVGTREAWLASGLLLIPTLTGTGTAKFPLRPTACEH